MEVTLTPEQEAALNEIAARAERSRADLVAEAVDRFIEQEHQLEWLNNELQVAEDELNRGEGIELTDETIGDFFDQICKEARAEFERKKRPA